MLDRDRTDIATPVEIKERVLVQIARLLHWNVTELDVPPPGVGLKTVTAAVPVAVMSLARIWAWSCVLLTKVVVRSLAFHRTTEEAT